MKMYNAPRIDPFSFALCGMSVVAPYVPPHVVANDRFRQTSGEGSHDGKPGDARSETGACRDPDEVSC